MHYYYFFGQVGAFCGLKCILNRSHARTIVQTVRLSFFSSFTDSMPFELTIIVYVLGHIYVLGLSQSHFNPRLAARAEVTLSWARNSLMPANLTFFNSGFLISNMSKTRAHDCWRNVDFPYITEQFLITVLPWNKYVIFPSVSHFQHKLLPQMCHGS